MQDVRRRRSTCHHHPPFVCLEPWIGRCDNVGFDGELKDKYGEQHLKAGETFQAGYTITIGE